MKVEHLRFVSLHLPSAVSSVALPTLMQSSRRERSTKPGDAAKIKTRRKRRMDSGEDVVTKPQRGAEFHRCLESLC